MINIMQPFEDAVARERARRADAVLDHLAWLVGQDWLSVTDRTNRALVLAKRYGDRGLIDLAEQLAQAVDELAATDRLGITTTARRANK